MGNEDYRLSETGGWTGPFGRYCESRTLGESVVNLQRAVDSLQRALRFYGGLTQDQTTTREERE